MIDIAILLTISAVLLYQAVYELNRNELRKRIGLRLEAAIRGSK